MYAGAYMHFPLYLDRSTRARVIMYVTSGICVLCEQDDEYKRSMRVVVSKHSYYEPFLLILYIIMFNIIVISV